MITHNCLTRMRWLAQFMDKSQSLTFMDCWRRHFIIMKQNLMWLLSSEPKHCPVTSHGNIFISSVEIIYFPNLTAATIICNIYFHLPCPDSLLGLLLLGFSPPTFWNHSPGVPGEVLLAKGKDCFPTYILEALCKSGSSLDLFCYFFPHYMHTSGHRETSPVLLVISASSLRCAMKSLLCANSSIIHLP